MLANTAALPLVPGHREEVGQTFPSRAAFMRKEGNQNVESQHRRPLTKLLPGP
jgi:hypothetical protein